MTRVLLFPGQGSQYIGMGKDIAEAFPEARQVFEEVDDALQQKLSDIIFFGPEEKLQQTVNTQPALMAVSLAIMRVLATQGEQNPIHDCCYVAGHSLGEYSALCAAQAMTLQDTARLLRIRGEAMQKAVPEGKGGMVALIGMAEERMAALLKDSNGYVQLANDNGGGQVVVSGDRQGVEYIMKHAAEYGAKRVVKLPVSAPFHSALIAPAADVMAEALEHIALNAPMVPLIANVTAKPVETAQEIKNLLVRQVTATVRWRESVLFMSEKGIKEVVEIGAGKVLCGLVKRMDKTIQTSAINTIRDIEGLLTK